MSENVSVLDPSAQSMAGLSGKYLTFRLGREEYGIGILQVQEIIGIMPVTHIPRAPEYVRGVINLRGRVIPVVDLRIKLGMDGKEDSEKTCIIVVQVPGDGGHITIGFIVDEVSEVLDIATADIQEPPSMGSGVDTEYILGMARMKGGVKILVDIERVLSSEETVQLTATM
ncbi:MAG: purine-binding chemotaxis protein CheW [Candidatus Hydrogenedentes bacterium]|nr:purine-binding chemotaxis protein CheW [Candidatus Hydrogenedentota bacterium]